MEEDPIVAWYTKEHSAKGKNVFLKEMQPFIEWLEAAVSYFDVHECVEEGRDCFVVVTWVC